MLILPRLMPENPDLESSSSRMPWKCHGGMSSECEWIEVEDLEEFQVLVGHRRSLERVVSVLQVVGFRKFPTRICICLVWYMHHVFEILT